MSELVDLYQRVVIDHNRNPRHYYKLEPHSHKAEGFNPLCGDQVTLYLRVENGVVRGASFQGESCAVATASASLLTAALQGRGIDEARELIAKVEGLISGDPDSDSSEALGDLAVLANVRAFPGRTKCAPVARPPLAAPRDAAAA
ncbi:MAG: SUF system NifU family Fe-S cluster assembly protein, partial [Ectothiorhodospiraceae bacterium]|nr:SUF system NifU family Fe-S cluster assembly protein [Ectothiorhodospiraceae bacterium]